MNIIQCLPDNVACVVDKHCQGIRQLHMRVGKPVYLNIAGKWYYIKDNGLTTSSVACPTMSQDDINNCINRACDNSIFAFEQQLVKGYMTIDGGVRIGVAGDIVSGNEGVHCFSRYTSVCIRFPHHIANCSIMVDDQQCNTIIIGPPGSGKTTMLRDLVCRMSSKYNCVVIDDRGEISGCDSFDKLATNVDIIRWGDRTYSMLLAIRSLTPQCIFTDELETRQYDILKLAMTSGVYIYSTVHGHDVSVLLAFKQKGIIFDRAIILPYRVGQTATLLQKTDIDKLI